MGDILGMMIAEAERRGRETDEPHAAAARYDAATGLVHVTLTNDCLFAFPARRVQGLENAGDDELGDIEILGLGYGLRWDGLDVDVSVPGLLAGLFGTRNGWYLAAWCRLRQASRAFRLDRIAQATLTAETITPRSFDAMLRELPYEMSEPTLV